MLAPVPSGSPPRKVFLSYASELSRLPVGGSFVVAAEAAISQAGDAVVGMKYFAPRDDPAAEVCRQAVRDADVFVLVVGFRRLAGARRAGAVVLRAGVRHRHRRRPSPAGVPARRRDAGSAGDVRRRATPAGPVPDTLWDLRKQDLRCVLSGQAEVCALAASRDGSWLAAGYRDDFDRPREIAVWDTTSGERLHRLIGPAAVATSFAVAPDDTWFVSSHGEWLNSQRRHGEIVVWDPRTGAQLYNFDCAGPVSAVAASADGTRLAAAVDRARAGGGGEVRVWSTEDWRPLAALRVAGTLEHVVWAGDVVVAGGDRGVYCLTLQNT